MISRWGTRLFRLRKRLTRGEFMVWLLGAPRLEDSGTEPGLILIQIDGLARPQLELALRKGRMRFLGRMLRRERYRLHTLYPGLPTSTPAVQSELFYGVRTAVPSFSFRDRRTGQVGGMLDAEFAQAVEASVAERGGRPLLDGGSAYSDILCGGAAEPHFCATAMRWRDLVRRSRPWLWPIVFVLYLPSILRVLWLTLVEFGMALHDAVVALRGGEPAATESRFIGHRILTGAILREWATIGAQIDATRGLPVIHLNFLGYDEQAHRRGPDAKYAHWSLRSIDGSIRRIWNAARDSLRREYDVWVYSDHGQEKVVAYPTKYGRFIEHAVEAVACDVFAGTGEEPPCFEVPADGPVGHVYPERPLDEGTRDRLAEALARDARVPVTVVPNHADGVRFWTATGRTGLLPEDAAAILGEDHPFLREAADDLAAMCRHPDAGPVMLLGWLAGQPPLTFALEHGSHAGPGSQETSGFAALPLDAPLPDETEHTRPTDLRAAALRRLGREAGPWSASCGGFECRRRDALRVVTYNVHSCVGTDGKLSVRRIARAIAQCDPDIVALQELDVRRRRTRMRDQAEEIARELNMTFQFHPSLRVQEELYGNAVLSRYPLRLVKAGPLPDLLPPRHVEPRGVMWVEVNVRGRAVQVVNTHLGLLGIERQRQVEMILGPDWLGHPDCGGPVILCGDLNAGPRSAPYRAAAGRLRDAHAAADGRPGRTCPSQWPLVRIDHVFVSPGFEVAGAEVVRTTLTREASDHLPLVVELRWPPA